MGVVSPAYFRPLNLDIGGGLVCRLAPLVELALSYEISLLPVNRTVDAVMIRRYHPQVIGLTLRIYAEK